MDNIKSIIVNYEDGHAEKIELSVEEAANLACMLLGHDYNGAGICIRCGAVA